MFLENIILYCGKNHFPYFGSKMAMNIFVLQSKIYEICFLYPFKHVFLYILAPTDYFGGMCTAALSCHSSLKYFLSIFSLKILITTKYLHSVNVSVTQRGYASQLPL